MVHLLMGRPWSSARMGRYEIHSSHTLRLLVFTSYVCMCTLYYTSLCNRVLNSLYINIFIGLHTLDTLGTSASGDTTTKAVCYR